MIFELRTISARLYNVSELIRLTLAGVIQNRLLQYLNRHELASSEDWLHYSTVAKEDTKLYSVRRFPH